MAKKRSLEREIHALREELAALKEGAARRVAQESADQTDSAERVNHGIGQFAELGDIQSAIDEFIGSTKQEISERPGTSVVIALLVGIVIGRLSKS